MHDAILAQNIYCANLNTEPNNHSGSWVFKGLGDKAPQITLEYELVTDNSIRLLTQPVMCEMGLYILAAIGRLKVASTTSAPMPTIPPTERKNRENFCLSLQAFPFFYFFIFSHQANFYPFPLDFKYLLQHL